MFVQGGSSKVWRTSDAISSVFRVVAGYLLLSADLFDVVEHVDDVPNAPRGFLDFGRQADATHRRRFHTVPYEGLWVEEPLEQYLPGCHGHLVGLSGAERDAEGEKGSKIVGF